MTKETTSRFFYGKRDEVLPSVVNHLNTRLELQSKDIGAWVGEPWENKITRRFQPLTIVFWLNKEPKSPFANKGTGSRVTIQVQFIDKAKVTYDAIRKALEPASWGSHHCALRFESSQGIESVIRTPGSSKSDAVKLAKNLLEFVEGGYRIISVTPTEVETEGIYAVSSILRRTNHKLHPHKIYISNQDLVETEKRKGRRLVSPTEVPIWYPQAPSYVLLKLKEGLKKGDDDA
jgi:hypothetical protein